MPGFLGLAAIAAVIIVVVGLRSTGSAAATSPAPVPVLGNPKAPVTLVEYADFQCPYCGSWAKSVEPQIKERYIDTGKVRLEWHDMAWIGDESRDAANAARCAADQGKFWEYHDLLFEAQAGQNSGAFSRDKLTALGARLGLDGATFGACVDANRHADAIQADLATANRLGITGTPAFFIGDRRIEGAQPFETFQAAIDAALAGH